MVKRTILFLLLIIGSIVLAGCFNKSSTVDKIHELLESVVESEQTFEKQQDPLVDLEKQEKEIYGKIITLGMKEYDQIVSLSNEALGIVDKRKEHMQKEEDSIESSKKEFEKLKPLIEELKDAKLKKKATELQDTMLKRYEAHDVLYENYTKGLEYDKELYQMFQKKDLSIDQLEEQIKKINDTYKVVLDSNKSFNEFTQKYNDIKFDFYKVAGIEIKEDDKK
ncbi:YkyA family protein [Robertmurraya andreesenii]|uniref:Chromosome segregation ATPase n=1 Tax=Anoxybacillus andreesenii TaxID=1325932 RepID=A0ABT9V4I0_9BACL|nr:YkyA family protein [Robertmurraya andreesenii]MDQ0155847.1 chromosome segregation ATPase [Robertmurraya andreesenii]